MNAGGDHEAEKSVQFVAGLLIVMDFVMTGATHSP
jgi:hypothetical protein